MIHCFSGILAGRVSFVLEMRNLDRAFCKDDVFAALGASIISLSINALVCINSASV